VIHAFGHPDPPVPRLLRALEARGHTIARAGGETQREAATLVLGAGPELDPLAFGVLLGSWARAPGARVLVVSALGTHPDARAARLQRLWALEEQVRAIGLPSLTLRLAPLVGAASPLWLRLRSRPALPRRGRSLLHPVAEDDVVETLDRALAGRVAWTGWYEVAGADVLSLAELAALAAAAGPRLPPGAGAWEPPIAELAEHRLAESSPWFGHFGITPRAVATAASEWAA
jgi:uncharacterized protein YbjT (DUF2867 family)